MIPRLIPLDAREEWTDALGGVPHAFAHTWENCQAMALASGNRTYLFVLDVEGGRVVCPVAERTIGDRADIVTPYGFSGPVSNVECPDFPEVWRRVAVQQGWVCGYLQMHPALERSSLYGASDTCKRKEVYVIDLRLSELELHARLSENRRRQLQAWVARDKPQTIDRAALIDFVVREQARFFSSRSATPTYSFGESMWRSLLVRPNVIAVGATTGTRIVAASIFGYTAAAGEYLFNISAPEGRAFSAALLWEGALLLKQQGVPVLNLGGGVTPGDGVARFKQRFGPNTTKATSLCQIYDQEMYARLCLQSDVDPSDREGYFPAYRRSTQRGAGSTLRDDVR